MTAHEPTAAPSTSSTPSSSVSAQLPADRRCRLRLDLSPSSSAAAAVAAGDGCGGGSQPKGSAAETPSTPAPTNQLHLTFADLSYCVRSGLLSKERKKILAGINGDCRPGELTAIMGPSGAGKSSLMDILAGFTTSGVSGVVNVNGRPRNLAAFRRSSAYIMQDDNLQPLLTVQEVMNTAADLKLNTCSSSKQQRIDIILREIGLDVARNTCTGNLSGGQKKRLAIALELISNPPIMFFDEPTSGLDSVTSRQCVGLLRSLAREGRTVVCTLHQPSATLFDMIDHLYIVAEGHCVYAGGTRMLVSYLRSLDLHCPTYHNPSDFLLEVINGDYGPNHLNRLIKSSGNGRNQCWRATWDSVALKCDETASKLQQKQLVASDLDIPLLRIPLPSTPVYYEARDKKMACYATSSWMQLRVLLWRNALRLSRDKVLTFSRLSMHLIIAVLVSTIFYKIGQDATYALDNMRFLFFSLMFLMFSAFNATLITFPAELSFLTREHFNRWYKLHSFYIANKLADLPVQITAASTYTLVVYHMSGQVPELKRLALFVMMCVLVSLVAQIVGLILGITLNVRNGVIFGPFAILPFMIFSGFFVHLNDAPPYLHWLFHMSFLKYGFEGVMVAVYGNDRPRMKCTADYCHFISPKQLLKTVDMMQSDYWFSTLVLVGLYVVLDILAYLLLRLRLKTRRYKW